MKYEHAQFIIGRFDHYYDTVNNKGAFYIGINTFIFGGVCVGYISLYEKIGKNLSLFQWLLLAAVLVLCIASTILTIMAIKPYSKDNHANAYKPSLMYFGGIAKHELNYFNEKFNQQNSEDILNDTIQQMHSLSKGLTRKFRLLSWASYLLIIQYFLIVPAILFIFKNCNTI